MAAIKLTPGALGARLRADAKSMSKTFTRAAKRAAARGMRHLKQVSKGMGIDDTGLYRNSWVVEEHSDGSISLTNTAPYAGIIEAGARPHPVNEEGRQAIEAWVRRKLLSTFVTDKRGGGERKLTSQEKQDADVKHIVDAICWKMKHHGQEAHWIVKGALPLLTSFLNDEINNALKKKFED